MFEYEKFVNAYNLIEWSGPQPQFGKESQIGRIPLEGRPKG